MAEEQSNQPIQRTKEKSSPWARIGLSSLALGMGCLAQFLLDRDQATGWAWGLLAAAGVVFAVAHRGATMGEEHPSQEGGAGLRWPWLGLGGALALAAWYQFGGNRFTLGGTLTWVGTLISLAMAVWPSSLRLRFRMGGIRLPWAAVLVGGVVLLGGFYRLHRIHTIPLEMGCDLPLIYNNIAQILAGQFPIFFTAYPGREGLFFYLAAPVALVGGLSHVSIKVTSALVGVATIPVVYLVGRELYDRWVGVLAAFFLAISHWHIILTRVGYRAATMPLMVALAWVFLLRGLKRGRLYEYALSGLFVGLGMHTYNAFIVMPFLCVTLLCVAWCAKRSLKTTISLQGILVWGVAFIFGALPLLRYAYEAPQSYFYRIATRATSLEQALPPDLVQVFLGNVWRAVQMFNYKGDSIYLSNVPYYRELGFCSAVLFVMGLAYAVWTLRRRFIWTALVLLLGLLLPSMMALAFPNEVPSAVRSLGALPAVVLMPAVSLRLVGGALIEAWRRLQSAQRALWGKMGIGVLGLVLGGGLLAETVSVYPLYFERYVWHQPYHNESISLKIAQAMDAFAGNGEVYLMIWPHWYDGNAVRAQLRRLPPSWNNERWRLTPGQPPLDGAPGKFLVIMHPEEQEALEMLKRSVARYVILEQFWQDGSVAFRMFIGER